MYFVQFLWHQRGKASSQGKDLCCSKPTQDDQPWIPTSHTHTLLFSSPLPSSLSSLSHLMVSDWCSSDTQLFAGTKYLTPDSKSQSEADYVYPDSLTLTAKRHHMIHHAKHICVWDTHFQAISNLGSCRAPAPVHWNNRTVLTVRVLTSQCTLCLKAFRTKIWDRSISYSSCFYEKVTHKPSLCKQIYSSSSNSDQSPELPVLLPQLSSFFFIYSSLTFYL